MTEEALTYLPDHFHEHHEYAVEMSTAFESVRLFHDTAWMDWFDPPQKYVLSERLRPHPDHHRKRFKTNQESIAIMNASWNYVIYHYEHEFLYELKKDPDEMRNLVKDVFYEEKLIEMRKVLKLKLAENKLYRVR